MCARAAPIIILLRVPISMWKYETKVPRVMTSSGMSHFAHSNAYRVVYRYTAQTYINIHVFWMDHESCRYKSSITSPNISKTVFAKIKKSCTPANKTAPINDIIIYVYFFIIMPADVCSMETLPRAPPGLYNRITYCGDRFLCIYIWNEYKNIIYILSCTHSPTDVVCFLFSFFFFFLFYEFCHVRYIYILLLQTNKQIILLLLKKNKKIKRNKEIRNVSSWSNKYQNRRISADLFSLTSIIILFNNQKPARPYRAVTSR